MQCCLLNFLIEKLTLPPINDCFIRDPKVLYLETTKALIVKRITNGSLAKAVENEVFNDIVYGSPCDQDRKYHCVADYGMVVNYS